MVGRKITGKHCEKLQALLVVHCPVGIYDFLSEGSLRSFAALGKQLAAHKRHVRAAPLAECSQQLAEKARSHRHIIIANLCIAPRQITGHTGFQSHYSGLFGLRVPCVTKNNPINRVGRFLQPACVAQNSKTSWFKVNFDMLVN